MAQRKLIHSITLVTAVILMACGLSQAVIPTPTEIIPSATAIPPTPVLPTATDMPVPPSPTPNTPTPIPASVTPIAIPGWALFEGSRVELWLPDDYVGEDLSQDLDIILERMRTLGPDFEQIAQAIEQNPGMFVFFAFDPIVGSSGFMTNVNIVTERLLSGMTLDPYADAMIGQLPGEFTVVERESITLERFQAERLNLEAIIGENGVGQMMYIILVEGEVWVVTYSTWQDEFEQRSTTFEQSIDTFMIRP